MSVQINQYHCFGYMLPYKEALEALDKKLGSKDLREELLEKFHDSAFDSKIVDVDGVSLIFDGMGGKYVFFGKVYQKSKDGEYLDTLYLEKPKKYVKLMVSYKFKEYFGDTLEVQKPKTILLTHYR